MHFSDHLWPWRTKAGYERFFAVLNPEGYRVVTSDPNLYRTDEVDFLPLSTVNLNEQFAQLAERHLMGLGSGK